MPSQRLPVVDADGHVYETDRELSEHFEGRYRELKRLGVEQIMYPSDFPHERARPEFLKDVPEFLARDDLPDATKAAILADNARRFYRF
jgi:predicted TIM-barrel fold metal-dependent hydrolase